jgi:hypothetical protein
MDVSTSPKVMLPISVDLLHDRAGYLKSTQVEGRQGSEDQVYHL